MPEKWRPKRYSALTDAQRKAKLQKDSEYEIAHLNLTADLKTGKITQAQFDAQHTLQWNGYLDWAKASGLYEQITSEQQLVEMETALNEQIQAVNTVRTELAKPLLEVKEKVE